jgi:dTDP-4-dehydrorhamnose 3,5-epimerase
MENHRMFYIPERFAHGFQTLEDHTEVFYQMSEFYHPESTRGIGWDDPTFRILWPGDVKIISIRDQQYPDLI